MAGTKEIKRRIKSIKNTKKITKAMELVSASKMKRAVSSTLASRLYSEYSWNVLTSVAENIEENTHPFFNEQAEGKTLIVLITSSRGLCGGYDSQIIKKTLHKLQELQTSGIDIITVGRKGDVAMRRVNQNITGVFPSMPDMNLTISDIAPLSKMATDQYINKIYNKVFISYTHFTSALSQTPIVKQLLPISKQEVKEIVSDVGILQGRSPTSVIDTPTSQKTDYLFEGDFDKLISSLAEKITRMQIYQMFLESNASEQSSRMMAMKNASEASGEMIDDLTLAFNKARQANITREISEISAGMASVN
jgi:F-type H+-transporting ATPase subunit gamma